MDIYEYIVQNLGDIIKYINSQLPDMHSYIANRVLGEIRSYLSPLPKHYRWEIDEAVTWDRSGRIEQDGLISLNQTVKTFLEEEYTGNSLATYESGRGLDYLTYIDKLDDFIRDLGVELKRALTARYIENNTGIVLEDKDYTTVSDCISDNDDFDEDLDIDFFDCTDVMRVLGISDVLLGDLVC